MELLHVVLILPTLQTADIDLSLLVNVHKHSLELLLLLNYLFVVVSNVLIKVF